MVLEEATSGQEPAAFSESQPTSDIDPYSSSNPQYITGQPSSYFRLEQPGTSEPIHVNLNDLPKPFTFLFHAQHSRNLANGIQATCTYASKVLQRPLKQEEADAFAFHWAKSMRTASYGTPVGSAAGVAYAYRFSDYRFPFWRPMKEGSRYSPDKFGALRGPAARAMWSSLRFSAYAFVGLTIGQLFFASYALTLHTAGRALDPRLKEFSDALQQRQKEGINRAREMQRPGEAPQQGETMEMARQRRIAQAQQQRSQQGQRQQSEKAPSGRKKDDDDMSPTGGAFDEDFMVGSQGDTGLMSDGQSRQQQETYRYDGNASSFDVGSSTPDARSTASEAASPRSQPSSQQSSQPRQSGGSAWERLRQNALSGNPAKPTGSQSRRQTGSSAGGSGDDFTFSRGEEDKQLARAEAQKEFDARIEKERKGQDFGGGSSGSESGGGRGGWRR